MECVLIGEDLKCRVTKSECDCWKVPIYCKTHEITNPLSKKRESLIAKRVISIGRNVGKELEVDFVIEDNESKILVYENSKLILEYIEDLDLVPYAIVEDIKKFLHKEVTVVIEKEIELTEAEIIEKALSENKPLSELLTGKTINQEIINLQLLNSARNENTVVINKNNVKNLYFVNMDLSEFVKNFSVDLFLEKTEFIREL